MTVLRFRNPLARTLPGIAPGSVAFQERCSALAARWEQECGQEAQDCDDPLECQYADAGLCAEVLELLLKDHWQEEDLARLAERWPVAKSLPELTETLAPVRSQVDWVVQKALSTLRLLRSEPTL